MSNRVDTIESPTQAFRGTMRISELAHATHETASTLRFYEAAGLLSPPKRTAAGHRDYDRCAVDQVRFIRALQSAGITLTDIATLGHLRETPGPMTPADATLLASAQVRVSDRLGTLIRMRQVFAALACPPSTPPAPEDC